MKKTVKTISFVLLLIFIISILSACVNSESKQQKIIDTFASFENAQDYVFVTRSPDVLYVRENAIDLESLTYDDLPCHYIRTTKSCAYFYVYTSELENTVDLLSLSYQTLEMTYIASFEAQNEITEAYYYDEEIYFYVKAEYAPENGTYLIYNLATKERVVLDGEKVSTNIFRSFTTDKYRITYKEAGLLGLGERKLLIENKQTGEEKTIGYSLLKTCDEGKTILKLGKSNLTSEAFSAYEYNGEIYIVYVYLVDGFLGYPSQTYVMKYDFESHTMEYYTSIFMEEYPEGGIDNFVIPE